MNVLIDTGVWYAFCDTREMPHERDRIDELFQKLRSVRVIAPWPVIYETMRTKFARNKEAMARLDRALRRLRISFLDDAAYKDEALQAAFDNTLRRQPPRPMSMVDCTLRLILDDVNVGVAEFLTFNARDFHDVCTRRRITLSP